jgi:2-polyprenyl-3-methyl-5-hydroxy-6-metoxy-1,4-benzoquinol methylase
MDVRTQRYFDDHAAQFDSIYHEGQPLRRAFNRTFRKAIYERFAITFEHAEPLAGKTVLDIGCGSGRYAVEFARRGAARVVGVDYAAAMLNLARQYAASNGVAERCEFIEGDFTTHTFGEAFDVVIAIGVFDYQSKPVEFLRRMTEQCRGRVIASFPGRSLIRMPLRKFRYWLGDCPVLFYREDEVRSIAAAAGLRSIEIVPIHTSGTGFVLIGTV